MAVWVYNFSAKRLGVRKGPLSGEWDAQDKQQGQADTLEAWPMAKHHLLWMRGL
jgi:hypothetical protein